MAEARLKTRMLEKAWLRILVLDSSKLHYATVSNIFVPLTSEKVDLVVIDDGTETNAAEEVKRFRRAAADAEVAVLEVSRRRRRTTTSEKVQKGNGVITEKAKREAE